MRKLIFLMLVGTFLVTTSSTPKLSVNEQAVEKEVIQQAKSMVLEGIGGSSGMSCNTTATYYVTSTCPCGTGGSWSVDTNGGLVTVLSQNSTSVTVYADCPSGYVDQSGCSYAGTYHFGVEYGDCGCDLVVGVDYYDPH